MEIIQQELWVPPVEGLHMWASREGRLYWDVTITERRAGRAWDASAKDRYELLSSDELLQVVTADLASRLSLL
jgi:hypothetical protein